MSGHGRAGGKRSQDGVISGSRSDRTGGNAALIDFLKG
jgi:hypothetical protein